MKVYVVVAVHRVVDKEDHVRVDVFDSYDLAWDYQQELKELGWSRVRIDSKTLVSKK